LAYKHQFDVSLEVVFSRLTPVVKTRLFLKLTNVN